MRLPHKLLNRNTAHHMLAMVALFAHLVAAIGAPVPSARRFMSATSGNVPYPCSDHPCGCATSEQCWAGDCCCFTLEQKLAWAESRGIEPPSHVRPAVEARKATAAPKKAKHPCCQSEADESCVEATPTPPAFRWVVGMYTQKCHNEGPAGLLQLDPAVPPAFPVPHANTPEPDRFSRVLSLPLLVTPHSPPNPPPRLI